MFNIGFGELIILGIIGLIVLGPEQLPDMARKFARTLNDLKRAGEGIFNPVNEFKEEAEKLLEKTRQQMAAELMNQKTEEEEKEAAKRTESSKIESPASKTEGGPTNES